MPGYEPRFESQPTRHDRWSASAPLVRIETCPTTQTAVSSRVIYVAPSHWGRGYGYALLRDAEEALAAAGRRNLALWVLEGNDRARKFYERARWRGDDGMKPFGDSGLNEVRYRKQV